MSRNGKRRRTRGKPTRSTGVKSNGTPAKTQVVVQAPAPAPSRLAWTRKFIDELKWWHWVLTTVITGLLALYSQLPSISIKPETRLGDDPLNAQFAFTNTGRISALNVVIRCEFPKPLTVEGVHAKGAIFIGKSPSIYIVPVIKGQRTATRGCGISIPESVPEGIVKVTVTYRIPMWPTPQHASAVYGFARDSGAGGYVYVPQADE